MAEESPEKRLCVLFKPCQRSQAEQGVSAYCSNIDASLTDFSKDVECYSVLRDRPHDCGCAKEGLPDYGGCLDRYFGYRNDRYGDHLGKSSRALDGGIAIGRGAEQGRSFLQVREIGKEREGRTSSPLKWLCGEDSGHIEFPRCRVRLSSF